MENQFVREYQGQLWIEIMLVDGMNDSPQDIAEFKEFLGGIDYDRVYLNTPVRPPAEGFVHTSAPERIDAAVRELGGISIDRLTSGSFFSEVADPYEAMLSIARRHTMNQFEVESFLESRASPGGAAGPCGAAETGPRYHGAVLQGNPYLSRELKEGEECVL